VVASTVIRLPAVRIDHVIYGVSNLQGAVDRFANHFGLRAAGGGEHRQFGTRNEIVPVGAGQYIELMAVADHDSQHPLVRTLHRLVSDGDRLMAVCLRPDNIDEVARRLSITVTPAERHNPDGEIVRWRLAGIEAALGPERLPFFIDWQGAETRLDREHDDVAEADGIAWVEYGGDADRLAAWIGGHELPIRVVEGDPGPKAVALRRGPDTVVIR
jgi:catechol 2,3-dioxygenase-like lactoylglutathione lyase family enzyme